MNKIIYERFVLVVILFLSISVISFSCIGCASANHEQDIVVSVHEKKINNFVFLKTPIIHNSGINDQFAAASGLILKTSDTHIFVITANHFCSPAQYYDQHEYYISTHLGAKRITCHNRGRTRDLTIIASDNENDICLLTGSIFTNESFKQVMLSENMPKVGEKVYTVSAPNGLYSPNVSLLFDGYFAGCEDDGKCVFTLPATTGSSGAGIYNMSGELISIVLLVPPEFKHLAIGPNISLIKDLINKFEAETSLESK